MNAESQNPFADLKIDSHEPLHKVTSRSKCPQCSASRKYFCYKCCLPMQCIEGTYETVKLPLKVDIIKHHLELDGKSTAVHARILAPDHVTIYTYPEIPQYIDKNKILLVFPYKDAIPLEELVSSKAINEKEVLQARIHSTDSPKSSLSERDCKNSTLEPNDTRTNNSGSQRSAACTCSLALRTECKSCECTVERGSDKLHLSASTVSESRNEQATDSKELSCDETASHFCHQDDNRNLSETCHHEDKLLKVEQAADSKKLSCDETASHFCHQNDNRNLSETGHHEEKFPKVVKDSKELSCDGTASHFCHQDDNRNLSEMCHHEDKLLKVVKDADVESQGHLSKKIRYDQELCLFDRVIFIDSTWNQCGVISRDKRLEGIQRVVLRDRETTFWRSQSGKPQTYLATIEAIYYFLIDYHKIILGRSYDGEYDNLLFFYSFMHDLVKKTKKEKDLAERKTNITGKMKEDD